MQIEDAYEVLRADLNRRYAAKEITLTALAKSCTISQGYLSSLMSGRQAFHDTVARKIMTVLHIDLRDLVGPLSTAADPSAAIPLVKQTVAATQPVLGRRAPLTPSGLTVAAIPDTPSLAVPGRHLWTRYVAIRPTRRQVQRMPRWLSETGLLILDRHDQFSHPRPNAPRTLYAVSIRGFLQIGYLHLSHGELTLVYEDRGSEEVTLRPDQFIVGRVCRILLDPHHTRI